MIISYLTSEYFEWAKLFMESLNLSGYTGRVYLIGRELKQEHLDELRSLYGRISITTSYIDWKGLCKAYDVSERKIRGSRNDVANGKLNGNHRLWMDITSVCDRMNSFHKIMKMYSNCAFKEPFLFFDIDTLFRKNIDWLIEAAGNVSVRLIIRGTEEFPKVAGGLFTLKGDEGLWFLSQCCDVINSTPPWHRVPVPFQQIAINGVFTSTWKYLSWGPLPYGEGNWIDSKLGEDATIWLFKRKRKLESLEIAKAEMERLRCKV